MTIAREEIFGPAMFFFKFETEAEVRQATSRTSPHPFERLSAAKSRPEVGNKTTSV
jgi:hypothetical protein